MNFQFYIFSIPGLKRFNLRSFKKMKKNKIELCLNFTILNKMPSSSRNKTYPIFLEASEWTMIDYWKTIFVQCGEGKFPKGMSISKGVIYVNKGSKTLKWELPKEPQEVLILCKKIFEENLGMKATQEKLKEKDDFRQYQASNRQALEEKEITRIKDVRKKEEKLRLIDEYVLNQGKELGMTLKEKQRLKNAILTGIALKMIKDITFVDNKITEIEGISVKKSKKGYAISLDS